MYCFILGAFMVMTHNLELVAWSTFEHNVYEQEKGRMGGRVVFTCFG